MFDYAARLLGSGRPENIELCVHENPTIFCPHTDRAISPLLHTLRSLRFQANSAQIVDVIAESKSNELLAHLIYVLIFEAPTSLLNRFLSRSPGSGSLVNPTSGVAPIHLACHSFYSFLLRPYAQSKIEVFRTTLDHVTNIDCRELDSGRRVHDLVMLLGSSIPKSHQQILKQLLERFAAPPASDGEGELPGHLIQGTNFQSRAAEIIPFPSVKNSPVPRKVSKVSSNA